MNHARSEGLGPAPRHNYTLAEVVARYYPGQDGVTDTVDPADMANPNYAVVVCAYASGQFRLKLIDMTLPPVVNVVREMCTYRGIAKLGALSLLRRSDDPEALCDELERASNGSAPGGCIRLDNTHSTAF